MSQPTQPANVDTTKNNVTQSTVNTFIVAVQCEQLFDEFESAWKSATRPSIETFLGRVSETEREDVLRELLGIELDERLRRGEVPLFAEYRSRFPNDVVTVKAAYCQVMNAPNVTRFQPIDRLGVGGQGEVWRVLDPDLDREVALKVVRPGTDGSTPTPASLAKFKREAEVTGKLEHPCIVPVYEAGSETPEGVPFYVMRILREKSLQVSIDEFHRRDPSPEDYLRGLRGLLDRFIDVCEALGYAHSRGVIHRDLKPVNVMLGDFGETLVVDWGLAKVTGRDDLHRSQEGEGTMRIDPDDSKTRDGAIIGTPRYMSPEQARGEIAELKPATDIYGLGAILFAILTGQPPIGPVPRRATTAPPSPDPAAPKLTLHEILAKVRKGEIPDPTTIDARVPKPLAAICLKALAMEPMERYRQATDTDPQFSSLAGDIRRWLNDEPVTAWPEPFILRAKRWGKKHETAVTSTAAAVLVAAVALSVLFVVVSGKNIALKESLERETTATQAALDNAETARQQEAEAKRQAEIAATNAKTARDNEATAKRQEALAKTNAAAAREQSELALSTLTSVIFDLNKSLENVPGGAEVRNRLMTTVLPQLDKISTQFAKKSAIDRNAMAALMQLADTILVLGQSRPLSPLENRILADTASDLPRAGSPRRVVGVEAKSAAIIAERLYQQAHKIAQRLADAAPDDSYAQVVLLLSYSRLGDVFLKVGRTDDALRMFEDGLKISRALVEADPQDSQKQRYLSMLFNRLGHVFHQLGRTDDALRRHEDELKINRKLAEATPRDRQKQQYLFMTLINLGDTFLTLGRTDDALRQYEDGLKISRSLTEADPHDTLSQQYLSIALSRVGRVFQRLSRTDDALRFFEDSLKVNRQLAAADPRDMQKQRDLSLSFDDLGHLFLKLGRTDDARRQFEECEKGLRTLAEADPSNIQMNFLHNATLKNLAAMFLQFGQSDESLRLLEEGLKSSRALAQVDPHNAQTQRYLALWFKALGDVLLKLGRTEDAQRQFEQGLKINRVLNEADP